MMTYGSSWHHYTLCLQDSLNLCGGWLRLFIHHSNYSALHSFIKFSSRFPTVPRVINFLIILCTADKRTLRALEIDLQPWDCWYFSTILLLKSSDNSWLFFLFSMLGVAHTGTQHKGWVIIHSTTGIGFYIASTCYLPQVSLNKDHMLEMKLFTQVPVILSSQFLEFCVKWCQIWLFFFCFFVLSQCT